eukprot:Selendium_serpulae@DN5683_c0_g1_i2.p1
MSGVAICRSIHRSSKLTVQPAIHNIKHAVTPATRQCSNSVYRHRESTVPVSANFAGLESRSLTKDRRNKNALMSTLSSQRTTIRPFFGIHTFVEALLPAAGVTKHTESRIVPFTAQEYFDVVLNVDEYSDFLPWCKKSTLVHSNETSHTRFDADLVVGFGWFSDTYRSRIRARPYTIEVEAVQSTAFDVLKNSWKFTPLEGNGSCLVDFTLEFQFSSIVHQQASNIFLSEVAKIMAQSFENRVNALHGTQQRRLRASALDSTYDNLPS